MFVKARTSDDALVVYQQRQFVLFSVLFVALLALGFGTLFFSIGVNGKEAAASSWHANGFFAFGAVFLFAGCMVLASLPSVLKKMRQNAGWVLLEAGREQLRMAPLVNMKTVTYSWEQVERIVLARRLVSRSAGENSISRNQAVFFFHGMESPGLVERSKRQLWRSPSGKSVTTVDMPKGGLELVHDRLRQLSRNRISILVCSEFLLDYENDRESVVN